MSIYLERIAGFVPAPTSGQQDSHLAGDGTFDVTDRLVSVSLGNFSSGGSIGSAAATVDIAGSILINQTTSGQTLTIPNPSVTTKIRRLTIVNIGSVAVSVTTLSGSLSISSLTGLELMWIGSGWCSIQ